MRWNTLGLRTPTVGTLSTDLVLSGAHGAVGSLHASQNEPCEASGAHLWSEPLRVEA